MALNNVKILNTFIYNYSHMFELLKDFIEFLKERKKWWLIPMIAVLVLFGILLIVGSSSALAPYIYSLF
jgi:hypothetical protein